MEKYRFEVICKLCNQSWPKEIGVDQSATKEEAVKFFSLIVKTHSCKDTAGSWQLDWELTTEE